MNSPSRRILFLRPDTYGDLFLFEPVPRLVRHFWPGAEVAVLIRQPYADVVPLLASEGVRWLTTACDPYREAPADNPAALGALRDTLRAWAPDCVVAASSEQTWLEAAVAAFLPGVRQISLGSELADPTSRAALEAAVPVDWASIYPEKVLPGPDVSEWEKNLRLASVLLGEEVPRWWPVARVPASAGARAAQILAGLDLRAGEFAVCAAAGFANVRLKTWPAAHYGETLAWLERERGVRALLVGHAAEREHLETVQRAARGHGAEPALWLGQDGEMPVLAALLAAARFYFGNDTGALHLAAALGRPVVPVFGGGTWPRFQPVAHRSLAVVQPLPCFGCAWDCFFADAPCVRTISPASVRRALEQFLGDDALGQAVFEADGLEPGARALIAAATPRLRFLREDSADRLRQVRQLTLDAGTLGRRLQDYDSDHRRQVAELTALLAASEADRDARLRQTGALGTRLQAVEADSAARLAEIARLEARLRATETDSAARLEQIRWFEARLQATEADSAARLEQIHALGALLEASEADRAARLDHMTTLQAALEENEGLRARLVRQVEGLRAAACRAEDAGLVDAAARHG